MNKKQQPLNEDKLIETFTKVKNKLSVLQKKLDKTAEIEDQNTRVEALFDLMNELSDLNEEVGL